MERSEGSLCAGVTAGGRGNSALLCARGILLVRLSWEAQAALALSLSLRLAPSSCTASPLYLAYSSCFCCCTVGSLLLIVDMVHQQKVAYRERRASARERAGADGLVDEAVGTGADDDDEEDEPLARRIRWRGRGTSALFRVNKELSDLAAVHLFTVSDNGRER